MDAKLKAGLINLAPIAASLAFGTLCSLLILTSTMEFYKITPFPEDLIGSFGNACYFLILVSLGAFLLYLLLKKKNLRLINLITGFALATAVFMLSVLYLSAAFLQLALLQSEVLILILSSFITALTILAIFRARSKVYNLVVLFLGGALGAFLGFSVPTLSAILILSFLAIYDVFAVYHGPVGKIARSGLEQLRGLSFFFRDIQMGLGDLTFYSMLSGNMLLNFGYTSSLASIVGILLGCLLSFKMLGKKRMFPGLPLPVFFGLAAGFLVSLM